MARYASWAAALIAILNAAVATLGVSGWKVLGIGPVAYVDAAIFGALAIGIRRMSRIASILALVLFLATRFTGPQSRWNFWALMVAAAYVYAFFHGIRAAFAYHRLDDSESESE